MIAVSVPACSTPVQGQYHLLSQQVLLGSSIRNNEARHETGPIQSAGYHVMVQQPINAIITTTASA